MRLILVILLCATLPAVEFLGVDYSQKDKQSHFVLGALTASLSMLALDMIKPDAPWYARALVGTGSAALVGAVKEVADGRDPDRHTVETDDFVATLTGGACVAITLCWRF
jgi:hypothetical protein